jgi:hypothetical protein
MSEHGGSTLVNSGFAALFSGIFVQALEPLVNWLLVMTFIIIADLASGIRKHYLLRDEEIRFSKGVRDTMGKFVTYYAFVVAFVMIDIASGGEYHIDKWACLAVCGIESVSIANNLLKPHGLELSFEGIMRVLGRKVDIDTDDIIKRSDDNNKEGK